MNLFGFRRRHAFDEDMCFSFSFFFSSVDDYATDDPSLSQIWWDLVIRHAHERARALTVTGGSRGKSEISIAVCHANSKESSSRSATQRGRWCCCVYSRTASGSLTGSRLGRNRPINKNATNHTAERWRRSKQSSALLAGRHTDRRRPMPAVRHTIR